MMLNILKKFGVGINSLSYKYFELNNIHLFLNLIKKLYICSMKKIDIVSKYSPKHLFQYMNKLCNCVDCEKLKFLESKGSVSKKVSKTNSKKQEIMNAITFIKKKSFLTKKDKSNLEILQVVLKTMS